MSRKAAHGAIALVLMGALVGCAGGDRDGNGNGNQPGEATHTMADGTVMDGSMHHDDDPEPGSEPAGPSDAARMVFTGQVVDAVTRIMGLDEVAEPSSSWDRPTFTCTFELAAGPLVLSVHDATRPAAGRDHFRSLRASQPGAQAIKGVYSLGLPAYETADGTVAFVKDGKTLEVDATRLTGDLGAEGDMTSPEIAYAVAASVLACWTEHA
ncbi:MAG: hypothetical protein L0K86_28530 [Actinomycetia bacterium]|nr:hypothetical protein [Actinomycetes bacterium]